MSQPLEQTLIERLNWAKQHSALCLSPYSTVDIRFESTQSTSVYQTCCCNLDAKIFTPSPGPDPFVKIKQQQNAEQWPAACFRCQQDEQNGGQSERIRAFVETPRERLISFFDRREIKEFELRVKFSNFCNLSCRSCNSTESSTYARIVNEEIDPGYTQDISEHAEYWQYITDTIRNRIDQHEFFIVHFIGGETLVQAGMHKLLHWMVDQNFAARIGLRLTTALTVNPSNELLNLLSKFREVSILLSIDSVGENYRYVRWPAKFEKIQQNLATLTSYRTELCVSKGQKFFKKPMRISVSPVFSLNNLFYIFDWLDYWYNLYQEQGYAFHNYVATLTMQTSHLDIQALPTEYRPALAQVLTQCIQHDIFQQWPEETKGVYNFLVTTLKELGVTEYQPELWQKYLRLTAYFDQRTKLKFEEFNQRLYNILSSQDLDLWNKIYQQVQNSNSLFQAMHFIPNVQSKI